MSTESPPVSPLFSPYIPLTTDTVEQPDPERETAWPSGTRAIFRSLSARSSCGWRRLSNDLGDGSSDDDVCLSLRALPGDVTDLLASVALLGRSRGSCSSRSNCWARCYSTASAVASKVVGTTAGAADDARSTGSSYAASSGGLRALSCEVRTTAVEASLLGSRTDCSSSSGVGWCDDGSRGSSDGSSRALCLDVAVLSAGVALLVLVGARGLTCGRLVAWLTAAETQS